MLHSSYHNLKICVKVGAPTLLLLAFCLAFAGTAAASGADILLQTDRTLIEAFQQKQEAAAEALLSPNLAWIDSAGRRFTRADALKTFPMIANADVKPSARIYGDSAVLFANQGKMNVLRVWSKSPQGWKLLLYQEVQQVEKSEPANSPLLGECVNPCKEIPFSPATASEKAAIASWQGVMKAMAE